MVRLQLGDLAADHEQFDGFWVETITVSVHDQLVINHCHFVTNSGLVLDHGQ